jgi:AcrR family transcriptional regulator
MAASMRRTQAERRATTRAALLDATIECLVEYGYAGVTTAVVARRAGVTRGAQAHHFATKAELVTEAVRHLARRRAAGYVAAMSDRERRTDRSLGDLLERLWEIHRTPVFAAAMELWLAARTDPELREHVATLERDVTDAVRIAGIAVLPELATSPDALRLLSTTMSTVRGVAIEAFVIGPDAVEKQWRVAKRHLLRLWSAEIRP